MSTTTSSPTPAVKPESPFWKAVAVFGNVIARVFHVAVAVLPYILLIATVYTAVSLVHDRPSLEGAIVVIAMAVLFVLTAAALRTIVKHPEQVFAYREKKLRTKPVWWDGHAPLASSTDV